MQLKTKPLTTIQTKFIFANSAELRKIINNCDSVFDAVDDVKDWLCANNTNITWDDASVAEAIRLLMPMSDTVNVESTTTEPKIAALTNLANTIVTTYAAKNTAYGDSFGTSVRAYGLIAALTRLSDKFHRAETLILHPSTDVGDERLRDTLLDMATYALMTVVELDTKEK